MEIDKKYKSKSLAQLDKDLQPSRETDFPSRLIARHNALLTKQIGEYTAEDLRLMIGQNKGLDYLIPKALEVLEKNTFAEGDFYPGDLLEKVLCADSKFWIKNPQYAQALLTLIESKIDELLDLDVSEEIKEGLLNTYKRFKMRHLPK